MRGIGNSVAVVSLDNQCMRQNDRGRDKEEYEGKDGCARKKSYEAGVDEDEDERYYSKSEDEEEEDNDTNKSGMQTNDRGNVDEETDDSYHDGNDGNPSDHEENDKG